MHEDKDRREIYQKEHCVRRWLNFISSFSKMSFNIFSFKIKINRKTRTSVSTGNEVFAHY